MLQKVELWNLVASLSVLLPTLLIIYVYREFVLKSMKRRASLELQGVPGPPAHFLLGNMKEIHEIMVQGWTAGLALSEGNAILLHIVEKWIEQYGDLFLCSYGTKQFLYSGDPDLVMELTTCESLDLGRPPYQHRSNDALVGHGIMASNGDLWEHQRNILAPEFHIDKVKGMVNLVNESAKSLISEWKEIIDANGGNAEIKIEEFIARCTEDVLSKVCFGSEASIGREIFRKTRALKVVLLEDFPLNKFFLPFLRKLPTKSNREAWPLENSIRHLVLDAIREKKKQETQVQQKDLLQVILEGAEFKAKTSQKERENFIVDYCKNIYLSGYGYTTKTASRCMMFLAENQNWQAQVRAEVLEICSDGNPSTDMLQRMKLLTMIIQETLRLYPPEPVLSREALKDIKIGGFHIPEGVILWTIIPTLHTDPKAWGPDSYTFNPSRFVNGVAGACKFPQFYMPFGFGPRQCLGENLAMIQLKMLMFQMLTNFSFSLSPKFVYSPFFNLATEPDDQQAAVTLLIKHL